MNYKKWRNILLVILALLCGVLALLNTPYFQTKVAENLAQRVNNSLDTAITFGKAKINYNGKILLKDVIIRDHHKDTLFYIQQFVTNSAGIRQLLLGNLKFSSVATNNSYTKIIHYENEPINSLHQFINKIKGTKKNTEEATVLRIEELAISNGKLLWDHRTAKKQECIENIHLSASDFSIVGNVITSRLEALALSWKEKIQLTSAEGIFLSTPEKLQLKQAKLSTSASTFDGDIELAFTPGDFKQFASKVQLTSNVNLLTLGADARALLHLSELKDEISGGFQVRGTLEDLKITAASINYNTAIFQGQLALKQMVSPEKRILAAEIEHLQLDTALWEMIKQRIPNFTPNRWLDTLSNWHLKGKLRFQKETFSAAVIVQKDQQEISIETQISNILDDSPSVALKIPQFQLNQQLDAATRLTLAGAMSLEGKGFNFPSANWTWDLAINRAKFGAQVYKNFNINGSLRQGTINTKASIVDDRINASFLSTHTIGEPNPRHTFFADFSQLRLPQLNGEGNDFYGISGKIIGTLRGLKIDDVQGNLTFNDLTFATPASSTKFKDFVLQLSKTEQERQLKIDGADLIRGKIRGKFTLNEFTALLVQNLNSAFPFFKAQQLTPGSYSTLDITVGNKIFSAIDPSWNFDEDITIKGELTAENDTGYLNVIIPKWRTKTLEAEGIAITILSDKAQQSTTHIGRLQLNDYQFNTLKGSSQQTPQGLLLSITANGPDDDAFDLKLEQSLVGKQQFFRLAPSAIRFRAKDWKLNPANSSSQGFRFYPNTGKIELIQFLAKAKKDIIQAKGYYLNHMDFVANIEFTQVALESILPKTKKFDFTGSATMKLQMQRAENQNVFLLNGTIDALGLNATPLGKLSVNSKGNTAFGTYGLNFKIATERHNLLSGLGNLTFVNAKPQLDLDLIFDTFPMSFLNPVGGKALQSIQGTISGTTNLFGPLNDLRHQGTWTLADVSFDIPFTNTRYTMNSGAKVQLLNTAFAFNNVKLQSAQEEDSALLNGQLSHNNFKDWRSNLTINTPNILLLNTMSSPNLAFYGKGYFSGDIQLTGPFKAPQLFINGKTEPNTTVNIPWNDDLDTSDTSYIAFVNKNEASSNDLSEDNDTPGLEVRMELEVTPDAAIEVVIDPETKSALNGKGFGNLLLAYNTKGNFNMWGDFIAFEGDYNFKNLGVLDKKFRLQPGGTVIWEGDPLGAQMDFEAIYSVPGGANPALLLDNPDFNRKIPTDVRIRLQGNLLKPNDPQFEIDFPTTGGAVVTELQYRLNDPQRSQLQALSLLSQGIFISEVGVSMQGLANNLYEKASDVFSSFLDENNEKLKIGVNYLQGDKSSPVALVSEDRLGLTLSTQISDRILINGKIGVPVGGVEETLIVGDVQIDFILNQQGTLKAKVFNKENEFRFFGDELGYTQGMGLNYQVDFNTFSELLNKIVQGAKNEKIATPQPLNQLDIDVVPKNN